MWTRRVRGFRLLEAGLASLALTGLGCDSPGTRGSGAAGPGPSPAPSPAPRRKVLLEIDQMAGTPRLQLERDLPDGRHVSLAQMYAEAGLDLEIHRDQDDLPRAEALGLADLHGMMVAFRSVPPTPGAMRIHLLVVTSDEEDPDTLGMMFDFGEEDSDGQPREGFAVFADTHAGLGTDPATEMLLTTAHELAHCFNVHHPDWEGQSFRHGSTIEGYSLADSVVWRLSQASKGHLAGDPAPEVWPGRGSLAFGLVTRAHLGRHQRTPLESFDVVDAADVPTARRGSHQHRASAARTRRDRSRLRAPDAGPLRLRLEAPKRSFVLGEAVVLTVGLHNEGTAPQQVVPLLAPEYRFLALELRRPGAERFEPFQSGVLADARSARARALAPGESLHEEANVFFGSDGWTFDTPGTWTIRADFPAGSDTDAGFDESNGRTQSEPLEIEIVAPRSAPERRAKQLIWGQQQGTYLVLGGGEHLKTAGVQLRRLAAETPTAAQAPAVRLALGRAALRSTRDPVTQVESAPRLEEARRLLDATLDEALPPLSVAQAQAALARQLQKAGRTQDARQVKRNATRKLAGKEGARKALEKMERESP
jgi:hypothetical protein